MMEDRNKSYSQTLMEQAKWEGKLEGIVEVAKKLWKENPDVAKIVQMTGLSLAEVEELVVSS